MGQWMQTKIIDDDVTTKSNQELALSDNEMDIVQYKWEETMSRNIYK